MQTICVSIGVSVSGKPCALVLVGKAALGSSLDFVSLGAHPPCYFQTLSTCQEGRIRKSSSLLPD
jgi:hypothetical protein